MEFRYENGDNNKRFKKQQITKYRDRGCSSGFKFKLSLILGVESNTLQIGCVDINQDEYILNMVQIIDKHHTTVELSAKYESKCNAINKELGKMFKVLSGIKLELVLVNEKEIEDDGVAWRA